MGTNKTINNTLSLKVLSFFSQIPGYEKIKISSRKMEMSPEKNDDARISEGLQTSSPPGSHAYAERAKQTSEHFRWEIFRLWTLIQTRV